MIRRSLVILPAATAAMVPVVLAFPTTAAPRAQVQSTPTEAVTPPPPVVELLSRGSVATPFDAEARGIELEASRKIDSAVAHLTFEPGASTGWHTHSGPTVVTVIAGEFTQTARDCSTRVFTVGQTFVERGPDRHMATNTGGTEAETIVTFFAPTGAPLTVPATPPRCAG